jgi:hypothetical protein
MSEGGRKVWNREQLLALNGGAVVKRITPDGQEYLREIEPHYGGGEVYRVSFWAFGDDVPDDDEPRPEEYPIDVIWEPER